MKMIALLVLAILASELAFCQVAYLQYRVVSADHVEEYIEKETKYWSKVAQAAIDKGDLAGWSIWRKLSVTEAGAPNFLLVNTYESIEKAQPMKVWAGENLQNLGVPFEEAQADKIAPIAFDYWMQVEDSIDGDFPYVIVNYAMPLNLGGFIEDNKTLWKPFFESYIESGEGGMRGWGVMSVLFPRGSEARFSALTWDGFDSFANVMNYLRYTSEPPPPALEELLANSKLDEFLPNGFKYSIVYAKVMSLSDDD
jgi:hypothetical protein